MKKLLIIIFSLLLLLSSCADSAEGENGSSSANNSSEAVSSASSDADSSNDTESDETKKVSYEYHDGENDYTVTTEEYNDDGTLYSKTAERYVNGALVSSVKEYKNETISYEYRDGENDYTRTTESRLSDGSVQKRITNYKNGKQIYSEDLCTAKDGTYEKFVHIEEDNGCATQIHENRYKTYIQRLTTAFDEDNNTTKTIEYLTLENELIAKGDVKPDDEGFMKESLEVYENGKVAYYQNRVYPASSTALTYYYVEITNTKKDVVFSMEQFGGEETIYIDGKIDMEIVTENGVSVYSETDGDLIAKVENMMITEIGKGYSAENIVDIVNNAGLEAQEMLKKIVPA